jgi:hypothetical protein
VTSAVGTTRRRGARSALAVAACVYAVLIAWQLRAPLACADACFVDHVGLYGDIAPLARGDTRLNAWILAWVQRTLLADPTALFDANSFHPARGVLAGSEHLIGLAIQVLPARAFGASAVTVHMAALALSAWLLGLSTFALVRWLVLPGWIAIAAGAVAIAMPWRQLELMHVQLLAAHWIPLLWLLALRLLGGEARRGEAWLFAAILALELLSSYYVAYLATITLGVLGVAAALQRAVRLRGCLRVAVAALPAYALLAAVSLPYLARERRGELPAVPEGAWQGSEFGMAFVAETWRSLAPSLASGARGDDALSLGYSVPATLALLALAAIASVLAPASPGAADPLRRRQRVACLSLLAVCAACAVLMLGNVAPLGGFSIELPAGLAARVLPGFASLRAPLRWAIPISLAAPILASVGLARIDALARARLGPRAGRGIAALAASALLALDLRPRQVGAEAVWPDAARTLSAYAALAALPPGPVLEAPWGAGVPDLLATESLRQLASTLHWRPLLNGFTAYPPPSYELLLRVARTLPDETALAELARLSGLRWIVLHRERLTPEARRAWDAAEEEGRLRRAWTDSGTTILELEAHPDAGTLAAAVAAPAAERTLRGVSRAPLDLEAPAGRLALVGALEPFRVWGAPVASALELAIENASPRAWPGFDADAEGLVSLRYAFADGTGALVSGGVAPLDVDVPAGRALRAISLVAPPARVGRFRLCLDLVQRVAGELLPLPVAPVEREVEVLGIVPPQQGEHGRLARYAAWLAGEPEVARYPCATPR